MFDVRQLMLFTLYLHVIQVWNQWNKKNQKKTFRLHVHCLKLKRSKCKIGNHDLLNETISISHMVHFKCRVLPGVNLGPFISTLQYNNHLYSIYNKTLVSLLNDNNRAIFTSKGRAVFRNDSKMRGHFKRDIKVYVVK